MAIQAQDLTHLICGPFKFINPTDKRDSSKRVIWECECVCGAVEHGSKADIIKFAGHGLNCPGHPIKGKGKPLEGFNLDPEFKSTVEHAEMARDWELTRNPDHVEEIRGSEPEPEIHTESASESTGDTAAETSENTQEPAAPETTPEDQAPATNKTKSTDGSDVLKDRLGLIGYKTECHTLTTPVEMLNGKAEKVVFAKQITGDDRVFLHIQLVNASGKRGIVSSKKKVPTDAWDALSSTLSEMNITWRERDKRRKAA